MAVSGIADVANTIETVISEIVTQTLIQESVALQMPGVWDRSSEVGPGMDQLDMIELAELAVQSVDETGAAMTPQTISPTASGLQLNLHKSIPFSLTNRGNLQSKIALVQRTVENGARSLAADVDDEIFGEGVSAAANTVTSAAADELTAIRDMYRQFNADNVPRMGRALVGGVDFIADLLGNNNVQRANEYGSSEPIRAGFITSLYGIQIFQTSSSAVASDGFLGVGMEAIAFARQRAMEFEEERKVLEQRRDYALTHLFGRKSTAASNPRLYVYDPA